MKDYYIQMVNNDPEQGKRASFATFYRTWVGEFPHLLFRTKRQHLECSVCQRHRLLIKGFSNNMLARKQQTSYYEKHLRDQWRDRCTYWEIRSQSRLRWGPRGTLALIVDGMDQAKFAYPRSPVMGGKQWANFTRPRAHIVGIKIHGWGMFFGISRADAAKDSNHHLEMVAATLSTLQRKCGLSFSQMHLHIQSDNCVREVKNNTLARWCSSLVSRGTFASVTMAALRSGHSHEDIDQVFGRLASFMQKRPFAQCPSDFVPLIQEFLNTGEFPYEDYREAFEVNRVRDWRGFLSGSVPSFIGGMSGPGTDLVIDSEYWRKAPQHGRDVILRTRGLKRGALATGQLQWLAKPLTIFDGKRIADKMIPVGGADKYLSEKYPTEAVEAKLDFAKFLNSSFPPDPSQGPHANGPCFLRPFQLGWRADFGLAGSLDPDQLLLMSELIMSESFRTDADLGGVEKLSAVVQLLTGMDPAIRDTLETTVDLFLRRVISDFEKAPDGLKKPLNFRDAVQKHQCCAAYIHFKSVLQSKCPEGHWSTLCAEMDEAFFNQFLDADLQAALSSSVPPGDIQAIGAFRSHMANFEKMKTSELEKREDELQREVFAATFKQLSVQLDSDLAILEEKFARNRDQEALDASRDEKFLRDRQVGDQLSGAMNDFATFNAQFHGFAGPTVIKHRRTLEDMFTTQKLDVTTPVLLRFEKTESQKNDSRKSAQQCIAASSTNYKVNGHVEFARAAATSIFDNTLPQAHYLGFVKKENYSKTQEALSELVYAHWDQSDESGPKARPRSENNNEPIGLKILAMVNGTVVWPDSLGTRFPAGSMEHKELEKKRLDFVAKYPQPAGDTVQPARPTQTARSTARPDFSIDNGALPLDPTRVVDLAGVSASDFTAERLASCIGKNNRPSVVLTTDFKLWIGNEGNEQLQVQPMPLFGFGLGDFEEKVYGGALAGVKLSAFPSF
ncbi:Uncharacterized protein SCF082_LOCUS53189 [Durusdinium trenchii]|uniref:DUF7869 domain-containing protein n=1 Tax=Durusdinium trenchii TaxID=1381693 RepID=A0ABP0SR25_9DINO